MPLSAFFDGKPIYSVLCTGAEWIACKAASKGKGGLLRMRCCQAQAVAKRSPNGLRFFAHKAKSDNCCWEKESDEHELLKAVAARTVHERDGWTAGIEERGDGWRADVLAQRGNVKIAVEIQLSGQSKGATSERNTRFEWSDVVPLWLKGRKNHDNEFGDGFQKNILGESLGEQSESVRRLVSEFLEAVESQTNLARAVRDTITGLEQWRYEIHYRGKIPCWFALKSGEKTQTILLGDLGKEALPHPAAFDADTEFAGTLIQLGTTGLHLPGFGSYGFKLGGKELLRSAHKVLIPILLGKRRWIGRNHEEPVPGSFVHYPEECRYCQTRFLRITQIIVGNPRYPDPRPPTVEGEDIEVMRALTDAAEALAERLGLPLGPFHGDPGNMLSPARPASQRCPQCTATAPDPLISGEEALAWPYEEAHFSLIVPMPGKGWTATPTWRERKAGDLSNWKFMITQKLSAREKEREAESRKKAEERREREAKAAEWRRQAEEREKQEEAERRAREEMRQRERERTEIERERAKADERRKALIRAAGKSISDHARRELWLHSAHPKTGYRHPVVFAQESDEHLRKAIQALDGPK